MKGEITGWTIPNDIWQEKILIRIGTSPSETYI